MSETTTTVRLHPWNAAFTWVDRTGPFRALEADQVAQFDEQGYVVVPHLLDPASIDRAYRAGATDFARRTSEPCIVTTRAGDEWTRRVRHSARPAGNHQCA